MITIKLRHFPFTAQDELFFPTKLLFKIMSPVTKGLWSSCHFGLCDYWLIEHSQHDQLFFLTCFVASFVPSSLKTEWWVNLSFLGVMKNPSFIYWMQEEWPTVKWCWIIDRQVGSCKTITGDTWQILKHW